ncbi:NAD(P)/FAD-dependent oxidoreductase [Actinomycetospora sp. TBRC 11914]|uniref:NAD(P)/FAD-dependent oxidoreductase n=1 Tax=Actinomycetospora sp. TBRC 11914 TaxID=2729387 RepID=UPI00145CD983|nr:FAD-dependent oxidoreductase [Actinomycetospora sp. TBRC 11914]NMO93862.1 FAD-dependent oxidoreductase [Actinomycetospora sp. TBRC 11914]
MSHVIVGAGLAGVRTAEGLREAGYDGEVVLLGAEEHRPYDRPPLSKDYLQGATDQDGVFLQSAAWFGEHGVDLRTGTAVAAIDRGAAEVVLADGERIGYERLVLATGSSARRLPIPGTELDGVLHLRTLDDSDRLRAGILSASRVAVIGGGWIGLEVAAAARTAGAEVTVLEAAGQPLEAALGPRIGAAFAALHREHGVDVRLGVHVTDIVGKGGLARGVRLGNGDVVEADVVLVGVGAAPNIGLAEAAELELDDGVLVDERLCTSDPRIHAVGDIAAIWYPALERRLRVEHWATAQNTGPVAAAAVLGLPAATYDALPYFFTDQYDLGMEYTGYAGPGEADELVVRGDLERHEYVAFWLRGGRLLAGMNVNIWDVTEDIERLIRSGGTLDPRRLADPDVSLADL